MISNKSDFLDYLEADRKALGISKKRPFFIGDEIWHFQILMRKLEYNTNCKERCFLPYLYYLKYRYRMLGIRLGFTIPINTCAEGLRIAHIGDIVINNRTRIGKNCTIHVGVNIGEHKGECPLIGDNVYIAPGVKIYGGIRLANNIKIGANAVVNKTFDVEGVTIAGVPAKIVSGKKA